MYRNELWCHCDTVVISSLFKCQKSILALCGLCANFNDNPEDDVTAASDISQTMTHWQANAVHVSLNTSFCDPQDITNYQENGLVDG